MGECRRTGVQFPPPPPNMKKHPNGCFFCARASRCQPANGDSQATDAMAAAFCRCTADMARSRSSFLHLNAEQSAQRTSSDASCSVGSNNRSPPQTLQRRPNVTFSIVVPWYRPLRGWPFCHVSGDPISQPEGPYHELTLETPGKLRQDMGTSTNALFGSTMPKRGFILPVA